MADDKGSASLAGPVAGLDAEARAQVSTGFDFIRAGKPNQAIEAFDRVIAASDARYAGDRRPRLCLGSGTKAGKAAEAIALDPCVCDAHFGKGFALIDLGRGDLAEPELRLATEMAPDNAHYANEYAELFKSRREWRKSYDLFAHAWDVVDKDKAGPDAAIAARALRGMGYNRIEMGAFEEAERLFRKSQEYDPNSEVAKSELGYIARKLAIGS
ncbi:hypothetical protein SAMN05518801_102197 [Novosphingobium sp. CF614]|nr:hypothetical protein SAMN05518801_102197 [Novosphingobium sp. CF614]